MAYGISAFLTFLLILLFPSSNLQRFNGLPLSALPEFFALGLLVPFLIFPDLRNRQAAFWKRWKIPPAFPAVILAGLLIFKVLLLASGSHAGFSACYRSPAEPTSITHEQLPPRECERSYENLFNRFSATRLDGAIWFGPGAWNLVFLNTDRYNYYDWESGNIPRTRIPLEASWSGYPDVSPGDTVRIQYVGEGSVEWGDTHIVLPPSYGESNSVEFSPSQADALLRIDYAFNDGSRSGQDPQSWGPRAMIKVSAGDGDGMRPLQAKITGSGWMVPALITDALILLGLCSLVPALFGSVRRDLLPLALLAAGIGLITFLPLTALLRTIGISVILAAFLAVHVAVRKAHPASIYAAVIAAGLAILHVWTSGIGQVLLRSAGNDPLSYESQAYSILYNGSLQGGEPVFLYIPMYRYIKFLEHAVFGDGDVLYAAAQLAAFFGGVFWLFRSVRKETLRGFARIGAPVLGAGLILLGGYYVSEVIRNGLSEYPTWILTLWVLPLLAGPISAAGIAAAMAALAVCYTVRPNQVMGIVWMVGMAAVRGWRKHRKAVIFSAAVAAAIVLLPLAHNLYYGHAWELSARSGSYSVNVTLPPSTWLDFLRGDPTAAAKVKEQIGMVFLISDAPRAQWPTLALMAFFLFSWLGLILVSLLRRKAVDGALLVVPALYLAVHLVYSVKTYYPRHLIIAYLAMAAVSILMLLRGPAPAPEPSADGPAVELPRT